MFEFGNVLSGLFESAKTLWGLRLSKAGSCEALRIFECTRTSNIGKVL